MPKENIIPIENKKPVEEVRYWDYESKELTKEPNKITEKDFFISCPLHEGDKKTVKKIGFWGAVGVGALTLFCPPAGVALATTCATVAGAAKTTNYVAKNIIKSEVVEECSEIIGGVYDVASNGKKVAKCIQKKL